VASAAGFDDHSAEISVVVVIATAKVFWKAFEERRKRFFVFFFYVYVVVFAVVFSPSFIEHCSVDVVVVGFGFGFGFRVGV
jgi:predicted membrane channel-forming protein YqfA (hemolysin III family)